MNDIIILTPVFNDWASFHQLIQDIDRVMAGMRQSARIVAVNDGSTLLDDQREYHVSSSITSVECVHLVRNLGHQRAIAVGLVALSDDPDADAIIVLDADGEDNPADIAHLLQARMQYPNHIIVARRSQRSEELSFLIFYRLYKSMFYLLTGTYIDFGNFCLIPRAHLSTLLYDANLWNHMAAAIMRSRLPLQRINTSRSKRYFGQSQMNFVSLVLHGLSAISVYLDLVLIRILIFSSFIANLAVLIMIGIVIIRLFTDLAIPGWATTVIGFLGIIIFQTIIFAAGAAFATLNMRSQSLIVPILDIGKFIKSKENLLKHRSYREE